MRRFQAFEQGCHGNGAPRRDGDRAPRSGSRGGGACEPRTVASSMPWKRLPFKLPMNAPPRGQKREHCRYSPGAERIVIAAPQARGPLAASTGWISFHEPRSRSCSRPRPDHCIQEPTQYMAGNLEFKVLGPPDVVVDGGAGLAVPPMQRRLLAVLLSRAGREVSSDDLADAAWTGAPPPSAKGTLQVHLHRLKRALGEPSRILRGESGYRIEVAVEEFDAARFEHLVERAGGERRASAQTAAETLRQALELWRGDAYSGVDGGRWITAEVRRLEELRLAASL